MEKLLLVGAGGFGRVVLEHASQQYDCAFLDDGEAAIVDDVPVIGKTSEMASFYPKYRLLLVTIGNNKLRERIYKEAAAIGYTFPNIIAPSAYISPRANVGSGCVILNNAVVQNNAKCGDGCILNPGVELHHDSSIGSFCLIYTNSVIRSLTSIGDRVWIGSTTTVSTSAIVPDDTVIPDGTTYK
ncbi:MAG: lipid carrier--UDP-N-acetylgalactosaminyltransferase [Clostridia bacterium]|nr:lipid carrier--UDP-N-acetylgalactosaminyltransferase [Clostridia bacterium]